MTSKEPRNIQIPFLPRFREPMLNGQKTWTSRTKKYGKVGDTFEAFGATFKIENISQQSLGFVASHWFNEGCQNKEDFIDVWRKIHPRKVMRSETWVWVHIFAKVKE